MANENISIPSVLADKIRRNNTSLRASAIETLEKYIEIISVGNREIRSAFTDNELMLLADICNGTMFEPFGLILENNGILMQLQDTEEFYGEHYYEKHEANGAELKNKLENLSKIGQIALIEAIQLFWSDTKKYKSMRKVLQDLR